MTEEAFKLAVERMVNAFIARNVTVTCTVQTLGMRGLTRCHKLATFFSVRVGRFTLHMCDRHHAGLRCQKMACRCFCPSHDHRGPRTQKERI